MKKIFLAASLALLSTQALAATHSHSHSHEIDSTHPYIVTGKDMLQTGNKSLLNVQILATQKDTVLAKVGGEEKAALSHVAHEDHKRCGGYFAFETEKEAREFIKTNQFEAAKGMTFADYTIDQQDLVTNAMEQADEISIRTTIQKLSGFHNRYYQAQTGVDSQAWLKSHWEKIASARKDITVDYFQHSSWKQPSVVATIKGESDNIIVIGGHADSIAGWFNRGRSKAPGADDNASGTSTVTETLRVLSQTGYTPKNTIMFMAYAAEEVGLLGSKDIAKTFKQQGKNVIGVLQLDMTNFQGSSEQDITIISDYTNEAQNNFLGSLIDTYLPNLNWGRDKCGYACSDHASWTSQGFPASTPFEAKKRDMNGRIHTANDTLDYMGGDASHALKFARLALAFAIELDR